LGAVRKQPLILKTKEQVGGKREEGEMKRMEESVKAMERSEERGIQV